VGRVSELDRSNSSSSFAEVAVVLLSKFPAAGKVKTRLTPAISPDQAAGVHRCFLLHMARRINRLGAAELIVCFDPPDARAAMNDLLADCGKVSLEAQVGGDLGWRIAHVIATVGRSHRRVLVLAVDSPDVPTAHLLNCVAATADTQVVLGLADDGGYWCLGVRAEIDAAALLHAGIEWSTDRTAEHTLANARHLGYSNSAGNSWDDVDQPQDLRKLVARLEQSTDAEDRELHGELCRLLPVDFLRPAVAK